MIDYYGPGARGSDPETSHGVATPTINRGTIREKILRIHARWPQGLTDYELAQLYQDEEKKGSVIARDESRKRRSDLRNMGLVADSGQRRPSPQKKPMAVWWITAKGLERVHELDKGKKGGT